MLLNAGIVSASAGGGVDSWRTGAQVTNWARFQTVLNNVVAENRSLGLTSGAAVIPTGTYPGGAAYVGGVLLPDGRVFCVPYNATTARIYDPATDTLTTPTGTYPGSGAYYGGVLLPDGRVFCVPRTATTARIGCTRSHVALDSNITLSPFFNKF